MTETCRTCGLPLTPKAKRGRPASFCSVGCRRSAEYSCRRLQDRLVRLENEAEAARRDRSGFFDSYGAGPEERATDIAREIGAAEAKLRLLLGALAEDSDR